MQLATPDLRRARRAFLKQRWRSRERGLTFAFSFEDWLAWWLIDDRWVQRGRGGNRLCMCRRGDRGPYSESNVYVGTFRDNARSAWPQLQLPL